MRPQSSAERPQLSDAKTLLRLSAPRIPSMIVALQPVPSTPPKAGAHLEIARIVQAFDPDWYRLQRSDAPSGRAQALRHFEEVGAAAWCSPSPLFDVAHYLGQAGESAFAAPFRHYVSHGSPNGLNPHPLIDVTSYRAGSGLLSEVEILSYAANDAASPPLNPLFERDWYERLCERKFRTAFTAFADYVSVGQGRGISIFPFLDKAFLETRAWPNDDDPGFNERPVTRLLDPFEAPGGQPPFSLPAYLAELHSAGVRPVLQAGEAVLARLLVPLSPSPTQPTEIWVGGDLVDASTASLTTGSETPRARVDARRALADFVMHGVEGLADALVERLVNLAARPLAGMIGVRGDGGVAKGWVRRLAIPRRDAFVISRAVLEAAGGFDEAFATPLAAAADLALRLGAIGYCNQEIAWPSPPASMGQIDEIDTILLFDRHRSALKTFLTAQKVAAGAAL